MKTITKYIILSIIAFMASSSSCQSKGPKQEYGYYEFIVINKSDLDVKYFIMNRPQGSTTSGSSVVIQDTLIITYDLTKMPQGDKICFYGGSILPDEEIRMYLQTEAKKTIASVKMKLSKLPEYVPINKHVYLILQPDNTIKTDVIDVPWEDNL